jgi:uncharacterized protein (TIGR02611 family)
LADAGDRIGQLLTSGPIGTVVGMTRAEAAERPAETRRGRFGAVRARARATRTGRILWRVAVTVAGVAVVAIGIVLLPLPGPGWLVIFGGLAVLGTEYAWAKRLLNWVRDRVRRWTQWIAGRALWVRILAALLSLIVIAALVVAALFIPL